MLPATIGAISSTSRTNRQTWTTWDGSYDGTSVATTAAPSQVSAVSTLISPDKTLYVSSDAATGVYAVIVTTVGIVETNGTPTTISAFGSPSLAVCTLDSGRALVSFYDASGFLKAMVLSISGSTVTANTALVVENSLVANGCMSLSNFATDQSVLCWADSNLPGYLSIVLSTSGTTVTKNTRFQFSAKSGGTASNGVSCCVLSATSIFVCYTDSAGVGGAWGRILSISGTTISAPTAELQIDSNASYKQITCCAMGATHALVAACATGSQTYYLACSISGTTITAGTGTAISPAAGSINNNTSGQGICSINSTTALLVYGDRLNNVNAVVFTLSGVIVTIYTPVQILAGAVSPALINVCATLDSNRVIAGYAAPPTSSAVRSVVLSII